MYDDFFVRSIRVEDRKFLPFFLLPYLIRKALQSLLKLILTFASMIHSPTPCNGFFNLTTDIIWINFKLSYITFLSLFIIFWRCKQ